MDLIGYIRLMNTARPSLPDLACLAALFETGSVTAAARQVGVSQPALLRNQYAVPLQHLRKVSERLNHLEAGRWTATTLYVLNKKVIFHEAGTVRPREIVSGQYVAPFALSQVVAATRKDVDGLRERPEASVGHVRKSRFVNHNAAVVAGTRIPTAAVRRFAEAGYSVPQIIAEYPDLTEADIRASLDYEGVSVAA